jgi:hypothetical protein
MNLKTKERQGYFKKAAISLFLTWCVPGLGHLYLGKKIPAIVFFSIIHLAFILGFIHDGRFFVIDEKHSVMSYLQTMTNVAVGPLDIAGRAYSYGRLTYFLGEQHGEEYKETISTMRKRIESPISRYGTAYLLTAGLMNILLLLNIFDISIRRKD